MNDIVMMNKIGLKENYHQQFWGPGIATVL